jgi:hypothetical protein
MSFDLGQALGGAVKQWNEMTDQEMVNRKLKIEEAKAKRDSDEALRLDEKRAGISKFAEIQHDSVAGYASSTSVEQLQKQYPDQPLQQDGQLTPFGSALANAVQNGSGFTVKPTDKDLLKQISEYGQSLTAKQGIQDPGQPAPVNPFDGMTMHGSRVVNKNFNPNAAPSPDDQKMYINDYKKALINVYKFSENPEDIIKVDKMMRDKRFEENAGNFLDAKRSLAMGDDKGALGPINNLMSSIMPGVQVGAFVRDKNNQLAGVTDVNGKAIPVDMKELSNLFSSNNLMQINELGLKTREVDAKVVTAGAEVMKAGAYQTDANTKAAIAPSTIANNIANTDSLVDKRKADVDAREATNFEKQKVFAMGIKDPSQMGPKERDRYTALSPIADTLWQSSRDSGMKMTGSQAVDIAEGLSGMVDKKTKAIDPSTIKYGAYVDDKTPDGMVSIKDMKTGQVKGYLPRPAGQGTAPASEAPAPTPGIKSPAATTTDTTKYLRSKNNRGGYSYTPSPRGLTKAQYAEADAQRAK